MVHVELRNSDYGVSAVEGSFESLAGAGVVGRDKISMGSVEERAEVDHVPGDVVCPFEHLRSNVDEERVGRSATKDHNLGGGGVGQEECHGGSGADGLVTNFVWFKAECRFAAKDGAGGAQGLFGEGVGDEEGGVRKADGVDRGGR